VISQLLYVVSTIAPCYFVNSAFNQAAVSPTTLEFYKLKVSSTCSFINLKFHEHAVSSIFVTPTCCFINNLQLDNLEVSSTCNFINFLLKELSVSRTWNIIRLKFVNLQFLNYIFYQFFVASTGCFAHLKFSLNNLQTYKLNESSACCFVNLNYVSSIFRLMNLQFHELINFL